MGKDANPKADSETLSRVDDLGNESIPGFSKPSARSSLVGQVGNFSVQYNLTAASIAVHFLKSHNDDHVADSSAGDADFPEPKWANFTLLGMVFAGAVIGMLTLGTLGDLIGRKRAMMATLGMVVLGALGSAFFPWGQTESVYGVLCACRLLVGIGVGGIYPLSASHSAENSGGENQEETHSQQRRKTAGRVGWAFFWQVPGSMSPYIVALILLGIHHFVGDGFSVSAQFRIIFGIGAIPAFAVLLMTWFEEDSKEFEEAKQKQDDDFNPWNYARSHPKWFEMRKALIGTAGTWFLYDVSFYGTAVFNPTILKAIFGDQDDLVGISWQSVVTTAFGVPGCVMGIYMLKKKGCWWLNFYGFLFMALMFALLAFTYTVYKSGHYLLFAIFLVQSFALNSGPSVATFVLPALCFPTEVRSTFHGVSAAAAKVGAVVGTFIYKPLDDATNLQTVMWVQAGFSLAGALLTYFFIPRTDEVIGGDYSPLINEVDFEKGDEAPKDA